MTPAAIRRRLIGHSRDCVDRLWSDSSVLSVMRPVLPEQQAQVRAAIAEAIESGARAVFTSDGRNVVLQFAELGIELVGGGQVAREAAQELLERRT